MEISSKQLARFKDSVSWVVDATYIGKTTSGKGDYYAIETDSKDCKTLNAAFCHASDFWAVVADLEQSEGQPWIVVDGRVSDYDIEKFLHTRKKSIVPFFFNVRSQLTYDRFILNFLDGMDIFKMMYSEDKAND